jgi:phage terminase small subunit
VAEYRLEDHHVRLLTLACEAWDRAQEARTTLETEGSYFIDRFKQPKAHPAIAVERESRVSFARLLRELDLEGDPQPDIRPPRRH